MQVLNIFLALLFFVLCPLQSIEQDVQQLKKQIAQKEDEIRRLVLQQPGAKKLFEEYNDVMSKVILKDQFTPEIKKLMQQMIDLEVQRCEKEQLPHIKQLNEELRSRDQTKIDAAWDSLQQIFKEENDQLQQIANQLNELAKQLKIDHQSVGDRLWQPEIEEQFNKLNDAFKTLIVPIKAQLDPLINSLENLRYKLPECERNLKYESGSMLGYDFDANKEIPNMVLRDGLKRILIGYAHVLI